MRFVGALRAGFTSTNLSLHISSKSTARTLRLGNLRAGIGTSTEEKKTKNIKAQFGLFGTLLQGCNSNPAHVLTGADRPSPACCRSPTLTFPFTSIKQGKGETLRVSKAYKLRFIFPLMRSKCRCLGKLHIFQVGPSAVGPNADWTSLLKQNSFKAKRSDKERGRNHDEELQSYDGTGACTVLRCAVWWVTGPI